MPHRAVPARERSFGLSVGGMLVLIAAVLVWRGRLAAAGAIGALGATLVILGRFRPAWLKYPSDAWWALVGVLGWINARVLLSLAFFVVLTPLGWIRRVSGRDAMARNRSTFPGWTPSPERYRDPKHFERMY